MLACFRPRLRLPPRPQQLLPLWLFANRRVAVVPVRLLDGPFARPDRWSSLSALWIWPLALLLRLLLVLPGHRTRFLRLRVPGIQPRLHSLGSSSRWEVLLVVLVPSGETCSLETSCQLLLALAAMVVAAGPWEAGPLPEEEAAGRRWGVLAA